MAVAAGFIFGFLVGLYGGVAQMGAQWITKNSALAGMIGSVPASIWAMKMTLSRMVRRGVIVFPSRTDG